MSVWDPNADDDPEDEPEAHASTGSAPEKRIDPVANQIANRTQRVSKGGGAYEGGLQAALAVVIAMGIGYFADTQFDSSPIGLFVGLAVGFGAFTLRIWQLLKSGSSQDPTKGKRD